MAPNTTSLKRLKKSLRHEARIARERFVLVHPEAKDRLTHSIERYLSKIKKDGIWVGYSAIGAEADPAEAMVNLGGEWAYPKVSEGGLKFFIPKNKEAFEIGPFGIKEPIPTESIEIDINQTEGVLFPGILFDLEGGRIGSGHAYYDRAMAHYSGAKVGIAYSIQISPEPIPMEEHDVRVNYVATEKEFHVVKGS